MTERPAFAGGDQAYLRDVQYASRTNLDARSHLHRTYATAPRSFHDFEAALIDWPERADVLECGCGTGRFWETISPRRSTTLTVTDLSPGMVEAAVASAHESGFTDVTGLECDVQDLPFDDASFDVVIANHMLYHVPDPDRAIAELARVVRADGVVLAATNGYGHMREINELTAACFGDHGEALYAVFGIDSGEYRLREQFGTVVWHAYDNDLVVDDPDAVVAYGLSYPPGDGADAAQRETFARSVHACFADGPLRIHTRAGAFECRTPRVASA